MSVTLEQLNAALEKAKNNNFPEAVGYYSNLITEFNAGDMTGVKKLEDNLRRMKPFVDGIRSGADIKDVDINELISVWPALKDVHDRNQGK